MTDVATTRRRSMSAQRRLRIWEAHAGRCVICGERIDGTRERWIVEHVRPLGLGGDDNDDNCGPAHARCATAKTQHDSRAIAKAKRIKAKHVGAKQPKRPFPGGRDSKWKKTIGGGVVRRGL